MSTQNTELLYFNEGDLTEAFPNLDGFTDPAELGRFRGEAQMVIDTLKLLKSYAEAKQAAMELRSEGKIPGALHFENCADQVYRKLPQWARW